MKKKNYKRFAFKTKDEWLTFKENTIGGSEASAVVGKSKWLTRDDLYNKFVLKKTKKVSTNQRIEDGIKSEPLIAQQFAIDDKRYKIKQQKNPYITYQRVDKPYLTVSPDRLAIFTPTGHLVGVEIKDVELLRKEDKENWEIGLLPDQYFYQALHYFVVLNNVKEVVVLAHLNYMKFDEETNTMIHDKSVTKPYLLLRKDMEKEIEWLEKKETDFWENHILKRNRPPLTFIL
jgi:predicted phage-related endonuclease